MINFIICEDEKTLATEYKNEIDKFMMRYDIDYQCYLFDGYTKEWETLARTNTEFKVYILDIKTNHGSGLNAARIIREELEDWNSMIIIITSYIEYKYDALSKRLMLLEFINKLDKCKEHLREDLEICIKHYNNRPKVLKFSYKKVINNIEFAHIIYIEKEIDSKRCIIHTIKDNIPYPGTINSLLTKLDARFMKTSRSAIVNLEKIINFDSKNNVINFIGGQSTDAIARDKKKGIIRYVRGLK